MIIFLPCSLLFFLNALFLGSQDNPEWPQALGFFILGFLFLIGYIKQLEPGGE